MRKLSYKMINKLPNFTQFGKWQSWNLNPGSQIPYFLLVTVTLILSLNEIRSKLEIQCMWVVVNSPVMSDSLQPRGLQRTRPPCPSPSPGVCSKFMFIASVILSSHLILLMPSPSAFSLSQHQGLFQWVICLLQMTKILELQLQHQSQWVFMVDLSQDWLV